MSKDICISVIVPVYNTEKYLNSCVTSIVNQSYSDLQIILVDDGSPDRSGEICDSWAKKDSRIQVIHQKNAGVSAARNAGLKIAAGELISFVDSDDVLAPEAYEQLLKSRNGNDMVMGRMVLMEEDAMLIPGEQIMPPKDFSLKEFIEELFREKQCCYLGYLCDKLLKREIIQKNSVFFDPAIKLNEDRLFLLKYLLHCSSVSFCDAVVYYYRQRNAGVITSTRRNRTVTDSEMTVVESFHRMADMAKSYSEDLYYIIARKSFESALDLRSRVAQDDKNKIKQIKSFMWENARICLKAPTMGLFDKLKVIGHCVLER